MNGYNPNYFDRKLVNSMKNAISQIVVNENKTTSGRASGVGKGKTLMQPDKTWDEVAKEASSDWIKRTGRDPSKVKFERKDGKVYADGVEMTTASIKTKNYASDAPTRAAMTQTPAQTQAPAPTTTTTPSSTGGGKSLFAPDTQKSSVGIPDLLRRPPEETSGSGRKPGQVTTQRSAIPTQQEIQKTQTTADKTGIPTALPTNVTPGTVGMTDMDGNPIVLQPTPSAVSAPKPGPSALPRDMSNVPGKSFRDRFSMGIGNITVPNAQLQSFKQAKETAANQNASGMGAYSPTDTARRKKMANSADFYSGVEFSPVINPVAWARSAVSKFKYGGKELPSQQVATNASPSQQTVSGASQQELQAAQNAAPAPANFSSNYAARVAAARDRDRLRKQYTNRMQGSNRYGAGI